MPLRTKNLPEASAPLPWVAALALGFAGSAAHALETRLVEDGLVNPVFVTAPEHDTRLFIVERAGRIQVLDRTTGGISTFLDIRSNVATGGERGLLGMAFDPGYTDPTSLGFGRFYVNYVENNAADGLDTVIERFQVSPMNANQATLTGRQVLLTIDQQQKRPGDPQTHNYSNHKAGWIGFRPREEDNLYIATGDGGDRDDPGKRSQDKNINLGKILRIDVHNVSSGQTYSIPQDNPFVGAAGNDEIWAYGLRNPYRNSFDRVTGDFYIADVGQGKHEEIDVEVSGGPGGVNYGWRLREGMHANPPAAGDGAPTDPLKDPIYEYLHGGAGDPPYEDFEGNSVTGGYIYRGSLMAELQGAYIFGDFVSGRVFSLRVDATGALVPGSVQDLTDELGNPFGQSGGLSSFGEDGFGELYLVDYDSGRILQLVPEPSSFALIAVALIPLIWIVRSRGARSPRVAR